MNTNADRRHLANLANRQPVTFFAPQDGRGKWHAKRLVTGEADCGSGAILSGSDRITVTKGDIYGGNIHPILCRRCARLNNVGYSSIRIVV